MRGGWNGRNGVTVAPFAGGDIVSGMGVSVVSGKAPKYCFFLVVCSVRRFQLGKHNNNKTIVNLILTGLTIWTHLQFGHIFFRSVWTTRKSLWREVWSPKWLIYSMIWTTDCSCSNIQYLPPPSAGFYRKNMVIWVFFVWLFINPFAFFIREIKSNDNFSFMKFLERKKYWCLLVCDGSIVDIY